MPLLTVHFLVGIVARVNYAVLLGLFLWSCSYGHQSQMALDFILVTNYAVSTSNYKASSSVSTWLFDCSLQLVMNPQKLKEI